MAMRLIRKLVEALQASKGHHDAWERECARDQGLEAQIDEALAAGHEALEGGVSCFDMDRMKAALAGPTIMVPNGLSRDEIVEFILAQIDEAPGGGS